MTPQSLIKYHGPRGIARRAPRSLCKRRQRGSGGTSEVPTAFFCFFFPKKEEVSQTLMLDLKQKTSIIHQSKKTKTAPGRNAI